MKCPANSISRRMSGSRLLLRVKILVSILLIFILTSGCVIKLGPGKDSVRAGVFKSFDKGNNWVEKNLFIHSGGIGSIVGLNVLDLVFDPQDNRAVYLASANSGLFYSYDSGDSWMKAGPVGDARIESVAVDPQNKCVIYATLANTVVKSVDCSRSWAEIYVDTRSDKMITALAVDSYNNLVVYAGNNAGDVLKSVDGGGNWQVANRVNSSVAKILINPKNTRIVYVASKGKGIFKTADSGSSWVGLNDDLKKYSGALEYRDLIFDSTRSDSLLLVAKYGLLKTDDGGQTWQPIELITPPATTDIYSVAISPKNNKEIYYATASTFYKTVDGGINWITKRLPTAAAATTLLISPVDSSIIYMGLTNLGK